MELSKLPKLRVSFRQRLQQSTLVRRRRPISARFLARARSPAQAQHRRLRPISRRNYDEWNEPWVEVKHTSTLREPVALVE